MDKKVYIYFHLNPKTKEIFYVGIGINKRAWIFSGGRNKEYLSYIKKCGNPIVEIYKDNLNKKEACELEMFLIKKYGRKGIDEGGILLNKSMGGQFANLGSKHSKETCEKISRNNKGKPKHSQEQKEKWKKERSGRKVNRNPNHVKSDKGRPKPKGFGENRHRKILQYDLEGNFIKEWKSHKEILNILNIKGAAIWANIKGITKQSHGYIWKYK